MSKPADQSGTDADNVTWRELGLELKSFRLEVRLLVLVSLFVTRLHLPETISVGSIAAVIGVGAVKSFLAR